MAIRIRDGTRRNPKRKGYYTIEADTREDVVRLRGSEIMRRVAVQGAQGIERQREAQRQGEDVRYPNGKRLRLEIAAAENAVNFMRQRVPGGPPAVRTTISLGAYIRNGRVVRG